MATESAQDSLDKQNQFLAENLASKVNRLKNVKLLSNKQEFQLKITNKNRLLKYIYTYSLSLVKLIKETI